MFNLLFAIFTSTIPLENKTTSWFNFGGGINYTTIFLILLIFAWLIQRESNKPIFIKNPLNVPILLFVLFTYISLWTGYFKFGIPPFGEDLHRYKRFISLFILFFIAVNNLSNKKISKRIIFVMTFMIVLIGLVAIKEFRSAGILHFSDRHRIELLGINPNYLGALFAQYMPLFVSFSIISKQFKSKVFYSICFLICLPALFFTYSRGAYLAIAGAILVIGFLGGKKVFLKLFLLLIIVGFLQSVLFGHGHLLPVSVRERIELMKQENLKRDISVTSRQEVWALSRQLIGESPIIGYGYGASHRILPIDIHNMYLKFALDCGIPTLLLFIVLILKAFKISLKVFKNGKDDFEKSVSLGFIGSLTALAIGNIFGERFNRFAVNGYFMILMAMVTRFYFEQNNFRKLKKIESKNQCR